MSDHPKVDDAPGLIWRPHGRGWEARWQCRTGLVTKGFKPKSSKLWAGICPNDSDRAHISNNCRRLQDEMLEFSRSGIDLSTKDKTFVSKFPDYSVDDSIWGYTYFVRRGDLIKIGHSGAPKQRVKALGKGIKVLAIVLNTVIGEGAAHRKFDHLRHEGEWFRADPELLEFIETIRCQSSETWKAA